MSKKQHIGAGEVFLAVGIVAIAVIAGVTMNTSSELTEQEKRDRKDICTAVNTLKSKFKDSTKIKIKIEIVDSKDQNINCAAYLQKPSP